MHGTDFISWDVTHIYTMRQRTALFCEVPEVAWLLSSGYSDYCIPLGDRGEGALKLRAVRGRGLRTMLDANAIWSSSCLRRDSATIGVMFWKLRRLSIVLVVAMGSLVAVVAAWQHLRAMRSLLSGSCFQCTLGEAMASASAANADRNAHAAELARLRVIGTDGPYRKSETSLGSFWAPADTDVAFLVAEQQGGVYGPIPVGAVVADCGANIGTYTRLALRAGASRVIAIEPVEENVEVLRRNFSSEIAQGRVVLVPKGVWDREEVLEMQAYDNTALDSFVLNDRPESKTAPQTIRLPVTTLDKIVAELGIDRIDLIKMDIEGAELRALAGAADTIRRFRPRLVIATENQSSDVRDIPSYVLSSFPNYRLEFGPTSIQADTGLRPTVAFFIPSAESVPDGQ